MKNSFLNKVTAERKVLNVVNKDVPPSKQLTGLSKAAIHLWCQKIACKEESELILQLIEVGKLCQRLSDRSHETFLPLEADISTQIENSLEILRFHLRTLK